MPSQHAKVGAIKWPRWFVVIGFGIGLASMLIIPALRGPDEYSHLQRVATIDHGYLVPPAQDRTPANYTMNGCLATYSWAASNRSLGTAEYPWTEQFGHFGCGRSLNLRAAGHDWIANTEINPFLPYLPAWVGLRLGNALGGATWAFYGARLVQLCAYIGLVWFALRLLPWGRPFLFAVALVPAAIQTGATISADPVTTGLAFVAVSGTIRLIVHAHNHPTTPIRTWVQVAYAATLALLAGTKPAMVPIVGIGLLAPTAIFGSLQRRIAVIGGTFAIAAAGTLTWALVVVNRFKVSIGPGANSLVSGRWIRSHPSGFAMSVVRAWSDGSEVRQIFSELITVAPKDHHAPLQPVALWVLLIFSLVAVRLVDPIPIRLRRALQRADPDHRAPTVRPDEAMSAKNGDVPFAPLWRSERGFRWLVIVAVCFAGFWLIEYGVAVSANVPQAHVVRAVQGRYFLPYLPLALIVAPRPQVPASLRRRADAVAVVVIGFLVGLNIWWLSVVAEMFYA